MTPLVRRYIKTSFVFLAMGLLLGGWITVSQFLLGVYPPRLYITAHAHLLLVGFMLMIVMGVATWMFPRPARDDSRYRPGLAEAVYWVITLSTAVRAAAEILAPWSAAPALRWAIARTSATSYGQKKNPISTASVAPGAAAPPTACARGSTC